MEWQIQQQDKDHTAQLAATLGVSQLLAWLLLNRGFADPAAARDFLAPSLELLRPGADMADMDKAVPRIARALAQNELIGIHGDYDVDGITGAALLYRFLTALGGRAVCHLPHRQREGYGMRPAGVEALCEQGVTLLITVDCGVSDYEAVARANELGADVIVIDHHQVPEKLPPALAVINPHRLDCPFHGENLSGVGAAFYLLAALRAHLREQGKIENGPNLLAYLDLVALGTIADVVPMVGLNRVLVHFGLREMNLGKRPGLLQLRRVAGILNRPVKVGEVAFQLAPRLNAAGRLDSAEPALQLLLAEDEREAGQRAEELERMNRTRRQVEDRILAEALAQIEATPGLADAPAIVVAGQGWHLGVIGIVASRIAEAFYRPAAVIGINQGFGKGSLRSVPGVNIYEALKTCAPLLLAFGGHPSAAGLSIREEATASFTAAFIAAVAAQAPEKALAPSLPVDAEWPLYRCDLALTDELAKLRPHGIGNPEPCFCARGVRVKWTREARSETLLLGLEEKNVILTGVGFHMVHRLPAIGDLLDIVYTPNREEWEGKATVKLRLKDFRVLGG